MRSLLPLLAIAALPALDVRPNPGLSLAPEDFTDLRVVLGSGAPVTAADGGARRFTVDPTVSPQIGLQFVHGTAGRSLGLAIGIEAAYGSRQGRFASSTGSQPGFGDGDSRFRAVTLGLAPKLVLRPSYDDPFDWWPGSVQIELGPILAVGMGTARVGGSETSGPTMATIYGARAEVVWTGDAQWQVGLSVGYEAFSASPTWSYEPSSPPVPDVSGRVSGDGLTAGLIVGRRH